MITRYCARFSYYLKEIIMYNLIVLPSKYKWAGEFANISKERFLEYTDETLEANYAVLDDKTVAYLKSLPTLFASEMGSAYIGTITDIIERRGEIRFHYTIDEQYEPIKLSEIINNSFDFDTHKFEISRNHWALKDIDLFKALEATKLLKKCPPQNSEPDTEKVSLENPVGNKSKRALSLNKIDWQTFAAIATILGFVVSAVALFI